METGKLTRLGDDREVDVDVCLMAATDRNTRTGQALGISRKTLYNKRKRYQVH
ncbi:MAG: sigma 54-interacting transcriptional regulator [Gammaproteobacteria bacterium]|nr:sigma 54-interacting transcriptional regulator [Gammaproteobacteria bacterium]